MGLNFTDDNLRSLSLDAIQLPTQIAGLQAQLVKIQDGLNNILKKDEANKVFYDNFHTIVNAYYDERAALDGTTYVKYIDAYLTASAKVEAGNIHYPTVPAWPNLPPKSVNQNMGLPTTVAATSEAVQINATTPWFNLMLNGFSSGNDSAGLSSAYSGGTSISVNDATDFSVGNFFVSYSSSAAVYGQITHITINSTQPTPGPDVITFTNLAFSGGTINQNSPLVNHFSGYINQQREADLKPNPTVFLLWQTQIENLITSAMSFLTLEGAALAANDATGDEAKEITAAIKNVNDAKTTITNWLAAPISVPGIARYGDSVLIPFRQFLSARLSQITSRVAEITARLGAVSQNADGTYTGSGNWYSFFKWIDLRINKASGTLFQYYNSNVATGFTQQQINNLNAKQVELNKLVKVGALMGDANGTNQIRVQQSGGFVVGDEIKLIDDGKTPSSDLFVSGISGQIITLNQAVTGYKIAQTARIIKFV